MISSPSKASGSAVAPAEVQKVSFYENNHRESGFVFQKISFGTSSCISFSLHCIQSLLAQCVDVPFCPRGPSKEQIFRQTSFIIKVMRTLLFPETLPKQRHAYILSSTCLGID